MVEMTNREISDCMQGKEFKGRCVIIQTFNSHFYVPRVNRGLQSPEIYIVLKSLTLTLLSLHEQEDGVAASQGSFHPNFHGENRSYPTIKVR